MTILNEMRAAFDHAAVAAPRIRDLLPLYRDVLGGTFVYGGDNPAFGYRALQLEYTNGGKVELMEPLAGSSFFDTFFEKRGGGLHHLTFKVAAIEPAVAAMRAAGYGLTSPRLDDPRWQEVFIHPREANGVLLQVTCEQPGQAWDLVTLEDMLAGNGRHGNGIASP